MNSSTIVSYINLGLTGLFILILIGLVIAALIGFKKGAFKSSFILLWMVTLVCVLIFCLNPLLRVVEDIPLNLFVPIKAVTLARNDAEYTAKFIVPVTNLKETVSGIIEGIYMLYNVGGTAKNAQDFALSLSSTVLKYLLFFILMIVIVIPGNILGETLWDSAFQFLVPTIFKKTYKGKAAGAVLYSVKYIMITILFLSPLTAITNTINQAYQKSKTDDTQVSEIGTFLDAYNSSVFANVFFNWNVNSDGLTFDAALMDSVTSATVGDATISLVDEINNFSEVAATFFNGVSGIGTDSMVIDYSTLLSTKSISTIFDSLTGSNLVTLLIPIASKIALNTSLLEGKVDLSMVNISDIEWKSEFSYMKEMANSIIETGILDGLMDENGQILKIGPDEIKNSIKLIFNDKADSSGKSPFESMLNVFYNAESSKLFNRSISAILGFAIQNDATGKLAETLNLGWDGINDISWGYESYVLLDAVHTLYSIDDQFVDVIFNTLNTTENSTAETGGELPAEGLRKEDEIPSEEKETVIDLILKHVSNAADFATIKKAIIGDVENKDAYDKNGRTVVVHNGKRIDGRSYCICDLSVFTSIAIPYVEKLPQSEEIKKNVDISDTDLAYYQQTIDELNSGTVLLNYKKEFGEILDIVGIAAESDTLKNAISNNFKDFIKDNNIFSIDNECIPTIQKLIKQIDNSKLIYSFATVFISGWLDKPENSDSFSQIGLDINVMLAGIKHDMKRTTHNLFHEVASLLDNWDDLGEIYDIVTSAGGDANKIIESFKDEKICNSLTRMINQIVSLDFVNPEPEEGDTFEHNENLYAILEFIFKNLDSIGITVTREDLKNVETGGHLWTNSYDASGNPVLNSDGKYGEIKYVMDVIKFVAEKDYLNGLDLDMTNTSVLRKFANNGEGDYDLPGLLAAFDKSKFFTSFAGSFIDGMISSSGLLESPEAIKLSFENVESWEEEGQKLGSLLNCLADLLDQFGSDFLNNFDLSKVDDIPLLNNVLHKLAESDIFKKRNDDGTYTYLFGKWIYYKAKSALTSFNLDGNKDIIKDPDNWNLDWGTRPTDGGASVDKYFSEWYDVFATEEEKAGTANTYYLVYRDFVSINGASDIDGLTVWCDATTFDTLNSTFTIDASWKTDNTYNALFGSDAFITAYNDIFEADEIGKLCKTLTYVLRLTKMSSFSLENLPGSLITDLLSTMNESSCLQIAVYNFYDIAISMFGNNDTAKAFIDLSTADIDYLITTGLPYTQRSQIRANRTEEISHLSALLDSFQNINSSNVITSGALDVTSLDGSLIDTFKSTLKELNESYVFHRNGTDSNKNTVFQSVLAKVLSNDVISSYLYVNDSDKDIALKDTYALYSTKDWSSMSASEKGNAKVTYLLKNNFKTLKEMTSLTDAQKISAFADEESEVDSIFECFEAILGLNGHSGIIGAGESLSDVNIATISSSAVNDVLTSLNESNTLYDLVPNFIYKTFSSFTANSAIGGINFGDVSAYYHYSYNGSQTTDYTRRYETETIDNICDIIDDYQEFNTLVGSSSLTDKTTLGALVDGGILGNLLQDIHDSYPMHVYNQYNVDGETHLTVFEQVVRELMDKSTLTDKAYDSARDVGLTKESKLAAQIKLISKNENNGTTIPSNYYSTWSKVDGENKAILDLLKCVMNNISGTSVDVSGIDISALSPAVVKNLLSSINRVDIISDAVPSFVKSAFDSMGLSNLTKLSGTSYAYYNISKKLYGGNDGLAGDGSEIDAIVAALNNLYDEDAVGNKYANLSSISTICDSVANLDGVMKFLSNSYILNTNISTGVPGSLNEIASGIKVSARGIIMYNLLGGSSDSNFLRYVTGTNANEKAHALSSIYNVVGYSYIAESRGLYSVIKKASDLDGNSTFDPNDYAKVKEKGAVITGLMESAYHANGTERSYFASEIVSNVLDEAITNERTRIVDDLSLTYGNASFAFGTSTYNSINKDTYNNLNETEKVGLEGVFDLLDSVTALTSGGSITRSALVGAFTKMEGSEIANIYYLSRAHKHIGSETPVLDFTQEAAAVFMYGSTWADYTSDIYDPSFAFSAYGTSLANYLGLA